MSIRDAAKQAADQEAADNLHRKVMDFRKKMFKILQTEEFDVLVDDKSGSLSVEVEGMIFTHSGYSFELPKLISYKNIPYTRFGERGREIWDAAGLGKALAEMERMFPELIEVNEKSTNAREVNKLALPYKEKKSWWSKLFG